MQINPGREQRGSSRAFASTGASPSFEQLSDVCMRQKLHATKSRLHDNARARLVWLEFRRVARTLALAALLVCAGPPQVSGQQLRVDAFPTGVRPLGVDVVSLDRRVGLLFVAVANSGEDSVSLFREPFHCFHHHSNRIQPGAAGHGPSHSGSLCGSFLQFGLRRRPGVGHLTDR